MLADGCLLGIIYGTATENSVKTIPWLSYDVVPGASLCDTLVPPHPLSEECVVTMCDTAQILSQAKSGEASSQGQRVKFSSQVVTPVGTPAQEQVPVLYGKDRPALAHHKFLIHIFILSCV